MQNHGIQYYITEALAHEDNRRVQELLSVGEHDRLYHKNEWLVREHLSYPYLDCSFHFRDNELVVKISFSGMKTDKMCSCVKEILEEISEPMTYAPKKIAVDASPEMEYLLSRMLGMEREPVELITSRRINNIPLTLDRGFCEPKFKLCGGQLNVSHVSFPVLFKEVFRRSPMKTLIVVEKNALPIWKDFNKFYGRFRSVDDLTVTTKTLFHRHCKTEFKETERFVVVADTGWYSTLTHDARNFDCKVKWAVGVGPSWKNSNIFYGRDHNSKLCITLTKEQMIEMGVEFPIVSHQPIIFDIDKKASKTFLERININQPEQRSQGFNSWRTHYFSDQLSLFLEHPELVPLDNRGEKLNAVEATASKISKKFRIPEETIDNRAQETCSVCLEKIKDASVTQCGHVFCSECMQELQKRHINCPMCRSKITNFLKVSDKNTVGKVSMLRGVPYRIPENETWGKKMKILTKYNDATIVTGSDTPGRLLKRKLQKKFRKRQILTIEEMSQHQHPISSKVIMLKPTHSIQHKLGLAWGKDLEVLELSYRVEDSPLGLRYY